MERLLAATGGFFSRGKAGNEKKDVEEIFQDARLVSTSRTKMGRPANLAKDLGKREQNAVKGSKGQYELDGGIEAELQAELGELVERVQSTHYSGRLSELDVDELLEDALDEGGPGAESQQMSIAMWEERLAADIQRKQKLQQQLQRQRSRRSSALHSGNTALQVERSAASCSAIQHQQRKTLPKMNLKSKTAQEDSQRLLGPSPGSRMGSKVDLKPPSRDSPACNPSLMRAQGSEMPLNAKPGLAKFSMPTPLTISSDSYESPTDASPATSASCGMFSPGTPFQERPCSRPGMLPPLQIGSQNSASSRNTTPGGSSKPQCQPQLRPWELQGSPLSRSSPKSQSGPLAPINAPGRPSFERSSSRVLHSKAGSVALAPMGSSSGSLMPANSNAR